MKNLNLSASVLSLTCMLMAGCSALSGGGGGIPSQLDLEVRTSPKSLMNPEVERNSRAMHNFLVGQLAYDQEDFDVALEKFQSASELSQGDSPGLHARLAELYVKKAKLEQALVEAELALKESPEDSSFLQLYAGILEALGRESEALPIYQRLIEENPEKIEPQLLLANVLISQGQAEDAIARLRKFERKHPNDPAVQYHIGRAYELQALYPQAEKYYRKAFKLHGLHSQIAGDLIRVLLRQQKIDEVREVAEQMLEQDAENLLARKILSEMAIGEGRFDEAIGHLRSLEDTDADGNDARYKIALIQIERQNFTEAEQQLLLVLAKDPANTEARYYLASIYAGKGRKLEAVEQLFEIPAGDEMFARSRTFAGFLLRQLGDFERAEKSVKQAFEADPSDKKTLSYLVLILRDAEKYKEARKVLESALEADPENDRLLFNYAVVLHDLGEEELAFQKMNDVVALNPSHADALNFVAYSMAEDGSDLDKAEQLVKQALDLRPNDGYFLDTLGWILYQRKKYKDSVEYLSRAVSLTGDDAVILEHYADALYASGEIVPAFDAYRRAYKFGQDSDSSEVEEAMERIEKKLRKIISAHPEYNFELP